MEESNLVVQESESKKENIETVTYRLNDSENVRRSCETHGTFKV